MSSMNLCMMLAGFFLLLLSDCQTEDTLERDYPIVSTLAADHITRDGARLQARITEGDITSITEYGFVWGTSIVLNLLDSEKATLPGSPVSESFSYEIVQALEATQHYYVRSYIRSGDLIFYGNMIAFVTQ